MLIKKQITVVKCLLPIISSRQYEKKIVLSRFHHVIRIWTPIVAIQAYNTLQIILGYREFRS